MESNNYRLPAALRLAIIFWIAAILSCFTACVPNSYKPRYGKHYTKQQVKAMKAIEKCPAHLRR